MSENLIRRQRRKSLSDAMVAALPRRPNRYTKTDPEQRSHYLRIPPQGPVADQPQPAIPSASSSGRKTAPPM
jgi:hypothetical protein